MRYNDCGLHGVVAVNVSFPDDSRCSGVLSDWDASRCILRSSLTMSLPSCANIHVKGTPTLQCYNSMFLAVKHCHLPGGLGQLSLPSLRGL